MAVDPILREVHHMKDQFARKFDYDLDKIIKHLMKQEKKHPERMVQPAVEVASRGKRQTAVKKKAAR